MAGKFIELKAAAKQLGISIERLQELREAGEVHGYKDGVSWKFKPEEIERLAQSLRAIADSGASDSFSGEGFDSLLKLDEDSEARDNLADSSLLISEELALDDEFESSSTVIGKEDAEQLRLADDDDDQSDVQPVRGAGKSPAAKPEKVADLSDELALADDLDFESDDALMLRDDELHLSAGSDDAVLGDSDGNDLAIGGGDSGIGLANPSDSGLSLEGESSAALELPEDEDMISLDDELGSLSDDAALQQDEEFLLSPSDEMLGDESSDSGSQVIALDDSGAFESDPDVAVVDSGEQMLVEDEGGLESALEPIDDDVVTMASSVPSAAGAAAPEIPYTAWNILSLVLVMMLLAGAGVLMADIVRNMWTWSGEGGVSSGFANTVIGWFGMN
jgi:hypothetical protein